MDKILDILTDTETIALYHALAAEKWKHYNHIPRVMGYEKIKPLLKEDDSPADPELALKLKQRTGVVRRGRGPKLYGIDQAAAFLGRTRLAVWFAIDRGDLPRHEGSTVYNAPSEEMTAALYLWEDELIAFQRGRSMPQPPDEQVMDAKEAARYLFGTDDHTELVRLYTMTSEGQIPGHAVGNRRTLWLRSELQNVRLPDPDPHAFGKRWEDAYIRLEETSAEWGQDKDGRWGFTPIGRYVVVSPDGKRFVHPRHSEPALETMPRQLTKARYRVRQEYAGNLSSSSEEQG